MKQRKSIRYVKFKILNGLEPYPEHPNQLKSKQNQINSNQTKPNQIKVKVKSNITKSNLQLATGWIQHRIDTNSKSNEWVSAGNLFFFLSKIKGFFKIYEIAEAKTKQLDSTAAILLNLNSVN